MNRRIQLRRVRGWRLPPNAKAVSRASVFGNPWVVGEHGSARDCVDQFEAWLRHGEGVGSSELQARRTRLLARLPELVGKDLACFCKGDAEHCHASVLLTLAAELAAERRSG